MASIRAITSKQPAIVVMPDAGTDGMYLNWFDGSAQWTDFHLQRVVPLIEQRFRVRQGRQWHAVAGISMGGQGTLRYASLLPGYFGTALALSPGFPNTQSALYAAQFGPAASAQIGAPVTYTDAYGPRTSGYAAKSNPSGLVGNLRSTRLYISAGNGVQCQGDPVDAETAELLYIEAQVRQQIPAYVAKLRDVGVSVTEHLTCGGHEDAIWRREFSRIPEAFKLFAPVSDNSTSWSYTTALDHGRAWQYTFVARVPAHTGVTLERTGRTLSGIGEGTVALRAAGGGCSFTASLPFRKILPPACP